MPSPPPPIDFVPVLHAMVEPRLRMVVEHEQSRLDDTPAIVVTFDPEIGPDRLTRPRTEREQRSWARHNDGPAPPMLFRSDRAERLLTIWISEARSAEGIDVVVQDQARALAFDGRLEEADPALIGHGDLLIRRVLEAALLLPHWDRLPWPDITPANPPVAIYLEPHTASQLLGREALPRSETADPILFAARPLASQQGRH